MPVGRSSQAVAARSRPRRLLFSVYDRLDDAAGCRPYLLRVSIIAAGLQILMQRDDGTYKRGRWFRLLADSW